MDAKAIYLKDAFSFLESLPEKAQRKVFYNIDMICGGVKDENYSRNWREVRFGK